MQDPRPILRAPDLRALGIPEPWNFGLADQVRFAELDPLAHVNNVAYLSWFENLRIHWLMDRGITTYSDGDPRLVLRALTADYLAEMRLNEPYVMTARASRLGRTSFTKDYAVFAGGTLRATGTAVVVVLDPVTGQKTPLAPELRQRLMDLDGAVPA